MSNGDHKDEKIDNREMSHACLNEGLTVQTARLPPVSKQEASKLAR